MEEKREMTYEKHKKSEHIMLTDKNNFTCSICQEKFNRKSKLIIHSYNFHNIGIKCKMCSKTTSTLTAYLSHYSIKHSEHGYPCWKCNYKTDKKSKFKNHFMENHKKNTGVVENKLSENNVGKSTVKKTNKVEKKGFDCDMCDTKFTLKNQLLKHKNEKHGVDITCEICRQVFNNMVSLRSHKFTKHTGKDKICEICGYSTKKTYDFKRHQVKHSNEYSVMCLVCNKGFYSLYEFNEHKNVHTAERPYQCEVCGINYSRRSSLILHRNRKHPEIYDATKKCQICNQVCLTKETMDAHVKTHVEGRKRYYCDICGKGLLTKVILKIHRRSHTGEKPFDCSYCGRAFSCKKNLSVHIRLHTGDRPYSCKVCWKAYTKSSALKAHEKIHANRFVPSPN